MITLTEKAVTQLKKLLESKNYPPVRAYVKAGGCAGYQFSLKIDAMNTNDVTNVTDGICIICDPKSYDLLGDVEIDWVELAMGGGFKFNFPEGYTTCGCGTSFVPTDKSKQQETGARNPEEHITGRQD